ncbi:up-regulator of cell proliferation-like [Gopherus flavomarginatus]|uniref:up-regulator of cell proliferation-like n=1 Tax=Gopherus flavomarginatus TaxID=286002 RepID=UPI0021CC26C5|nr:up-regulator of cell proliferation-like [Gopherus flavomarginatus]XP_050812621.1 up-regulator of cell proliferation-like [Gopherus flavomarginatus]XP_050812622.1 up-regulator of cell proliferation-like [Gopherus flavomarginatus]
MEKEPKNLEGTVSSEKENTEEKNKAFQGLLSKLNLQEYQSTKLRLQDVLEIGSESTENWTPQMLGDLPWHFLRKLMALNGTARNTSLGHRACDDEGSIEEAQIAGEDVFSFNDTDIRESLHPLDVLCAVLLCSDSFLQQEILSKMSMCQFALPLLLPALHTPKCTLLLWAMRDIVRKWRPHSLAESRGFREESLVLTAMPTISFVRLGSCSFSKSKLLNDVLSPSQQHHDFFIHRDMESGNVPREIADGLVEISWYFPGGRENLDLFPEPFAVTNLHGDIEFHWLQFGFLTVVSSAVFVVTESISEKQYGLLSSLQGSAIKYYFILSCKNGNPEETRGFLNKLAPVLNLSKSQLLVKDSTTNNAEFVQKVKSAIKSITSSTPKRMNLEGMAVTARELGIQVDEDRKECQSASKRAREITEEIKDVAKYKRDMLRLQGDFLEELSKVEKELCRMRRQGETATEDYKCQLREKQLDLRRQQNQCDLTDGLNKFINGIGQLPSMEKHYFLKWMKFSLDHITRENLFKLWDQYKEESKMAGDDPQALAMLDKLISTASLGVEHFMRELGQFYEAECSMVKEEDKAECQRPFIHLPGTAADLMLEGFPMELIDGDSSNIPLQWVTDVLTELHAKLGGRSRMVVITVLGVQSTGKSTLLNTMFGMKFAVSSGRCTRGAFMMLVKVAENFQQELGCDFILVIDTEGLKAQELAKLEDSYEHDNELATLVIGLSDITIVNMAMENATEMKDVLQIVVHAFLRMEEIGQKPNCQFVHQNVSDVSAHDQNMRDRKHLLEQLNEMTKAAARMEKQCKKVKFSWIMDYDAEKHNWYIPGLWHGVPPMAPVNMGYSESVCELKKYLFDFITKRSHNRAPKDIPQFVKWVESLWNAVKYENFIFSFRNSLVAEAYNQLSMKYSEWEWHFRKEIYLWVSEKETVIQNQTSEKLQAGALSMLENEAQEKLQHEKQKILDNLQDYFESGVSNLHLIEKYREDFIRSATCLRNELESYSENKCEEAIRIRKGQLTAENIQTSYMQIIEGKVDRVLDACRNKKHKLEHEELKLEFENMWTETLSELKFSSLQKREIYREMESQLRKDLANRGSAIRQKAQESGSLLFHGIDNFTMKKEYLDSAWIKTRKQRFIEECEPAVHIEELAKSLIDESKRYTEEKVNSRVDYDEIYCRELLNIINKRLQDENVKKLGTTACFEVDLKIHILREAAWEFQKMHEDFIKQNDPQCRLEKLKPQYFSTFTDLYLEKDENQTRARDFCDQCLKPALVVYINKRLGIEIVDDIINKAESIEYGSRTFFQFTVQKKLLEEMNFDNYMQYIKNYEQFVKTWIQRRMMDHYRETKRLGELEKKILSTIVKKVREVLESSKNEKNTTVLAFLNNFCEALQQDLIISKDNLLGIQFKNTAKPGQFCANIQSFLLDLEQEILSQFGGLDIHTKLSNLPLNPQDVIFKRVFGCGKQCPFCKVPCEAGGSDHKQHFASVHRPQGLCDFRDRSTRKLIYDICSSEVVSENSCRKLGTKEKLLPYKDYRFYYPDWRIQPDPSIEASDYWKFVFQKFNHQLAKSYNAHPADLPRNWGKITETQALEGLKQAFNMK